MPPPSRRDSHLIGARVHASNALRISESDRLAHAALPPLVVQGPKHVQVAVQRPRYPQTAWRSSDKAWRLCLDAFAQLPLTPKNGAVETPTEDYGGLGATFNFNHGMPPPQEWPHRRVGVIFRGVPACKKTGQSTEHIAANSKDLMPLLYLLLNSCAGISFSAYEPRFAALYGNGTGTRSPAPMPMPMPANPRTHARTQACTWTTIPAALTRPQ